MRLSDLKFRVEREYLVPSLLPLLTQKCISLTGVL